MVRLVNKRPEHVVREALHNIVENFMKGLESGDVQQHLDDSVQLYARQVRVAKDPFFVTKNMPDRANPAHMPATVTDVLEEG